MDKVKEVEAKTTWDEKDIAILIENQSRLSHSTLVRMGLATQQVVEEPVKEEVETAPKAKPRKISKK